MKRPGATALAQIGLFRQVSVDNRERLASVAWLRDYECGEHLFQEGDPSDIFFVVVRGGPLGAVATYESRPFPASAVSVGPSTCPIIPRDVFFELLEQHPSFVRGLLGSLSLRLVELTSRLSEMTGRVESRLARLFLRLGDQLGRDERGGRFIPLALSRQELAELVGTTIETSIRIMSRWAKDGILLTEKDGFVLRDRDTRRALAKLASALSS